MMTSNIVNKLRLPTMLKQVADIPYLRNDLKATKITTRTLRTLRISLERNILSILRDSSRLEGDILKTRKCFANVFADNNKYYTERQARKQFTQTANHVHQLEGSLLPKRKPSIHDRKKIVICGFQGCGKKYDRSSNLEVHMRSHTGEKPFTCDQCLKAFISRSTLNAHFRIHTGEKRFVCSRGDCKMYFTHAGTLRNHEKIHLEVKPFACQHGVCRKAFISRHALISHERTHTGEKPFVCKVHDCRRPFGQLSALIVHTRRFHTHEKPFECDYKGCEKRFVTKRDRSDHHRSHTKEKLFVCGNCAKRYKGPGRLRSHRRKCFEIIIK